MTARIRKAATLVLGLALLAAPVDRAAMSSGAFRKAPMPRAPVRLSSWDFIVASCSAWVAICSISFAMLVAS